MAINHSYRVLQEELYNVSYWFDNDLAYVLTGQVDKTINQKLSESIYRQMSLNETQSLVLNQLSKVQEFAMF